MNTDHPLFCILVIPWQSSKPRRPSRQGAATPLPTVGELHIVLGHERDGAPGSARSGRPAHPLAIVLAVCRNVEVDHDVHVGDVKASRCNVCGKENRSRFCFELIQTRQPFVLAHLPIKRYSCESETSEQERKSESGAASAAKDHEGVAGQLVEDVHQVDLLELERDEEIILQQLVDCLITSRDFNFDWILEGGSL